jgi:GNAT superfamily N-acetyltransferase
VRESAIVIRPVGRPGDLGWMVKAHGEIYAAEYGWDFSFEALVARIVADYAVAPWPASDDDPPRMHGAGQRRQAGWIAELDGLRAGCVLCVPIDEITAQLRILLVAPAARGHGIGAALVDECLCFAASAGYRRMRLWTNHPLTAARHIYLSRGFTLTEEERHHSYGADLTGQIYELELLPEFSRPRDAR